MKKDDWILLSFPAANRDPEYFEHADEVLIDREINASGVIRPSLGSTWGQKASSSG